MIDSSKLRLSIFTLGWMLGVGVGLPLWGLLDDKKSGTSVKSPGIERVSLADLFDCGPVNTVEMSDLQITLMVCEDLSTGNRVLLTSGNPNVANSGNITLLD